MQVSGGDKKVPEDIHEKKRTLSAYDPNPSPNVKKTKYTSDTPYTTFMSPASFITLELIAASCSESNNDHNSHF
jgi:hypothetical protein